MLLTKQVKLETAVIPQSINGVITGPYFRLDRYRRNVFGLHVGAMAAAQTAKLELLQATDAAGTGAKGIPTDAGQLATATITANTKVKVATLTLAVVVAGNAVTINGLTFTAQAAADAPNRVYALGANDTEAAANLAAAINGAYGVPGVLASSAAAVVTLTTINSESEETISITNPAATITPATVQALAYVEVDAAQLDTNNGFEYVAAKVTTTAAILCAVDLVRGEGRFSPVQQAGAYAVLG